jgi:predicted nucleic acid-binding protein
MVLELAVAAGCRFIVTFNTRDFGSARSFSLRVLTPREFLKTIGVIQ